MIFPTFLFCLIVNSVNAALDGDCNLEGVTASQWITAYTNVKVNDNESKVFKTFNTTNVTAVSMTGEDYKKYFDIKLDQNILTIAPSEEFKNFEKNEKNDENPKMIINLDFTCSNGKGTLAFYQPITDLNTYKPSFTQTSYSYKLPMPLPGDFSLSCLMDVPIEACDLDITNTKLNFAINPPGDFSIVSGGPIDGSQKCHTAIIKTAKPLILNQTTNYELTVTDVGGSPQSNNVVMEVEINEQTAVPANPQFSSAYYTATYDNGNENHVINVNGAITLEKKDPVADVVITGEHKDNFVVETIEGTVTVTLSKNLNEEVISDNVIVLLTLEAKIPNAEGPGRTALVVYMPKKECPTTTTSMPTTACPTTETPTECPVCTTEATTLATCPPCTTETPILTTACPTTETPTECPVCTTEATTLATCPPCTTETPTCPTTETPTECPVCTTEAVTGVTCAPCTTETTILTTTGPTTETTTVETCAPGTSETPILTTAWPTTETPTECPVCTTPTLATVCPTTEIPPECPVCTTEGTTLYTNPFSTVGTVTIPETSVTTECPPCLTTTTTSECPTTECPLCTTSSSECPSCTTSNTPSITEYPTSTPTECPSCTCPSTVTNCPLSTTLPIATECPSLTPTCPPCLTTAVTPTEPRVVFLQDVYTFETLPESGVTVGRVKAIAMPEEVIEYSIKDGENVVPSQLNIDENSGVLTLNDKIDVGVYKVKAHAKGISSSVESTADVEINVYIEIETAEVLIVKTVEENAKSSIPIPCPNGVSKCTYEFLNQYPETNKALFKYENGNLLTEAISLQEEEIKDFLNPQFTINLKLIDTESTLAFNQTIREEDTRHWLYLPEIIPRNPNTLLVSVVIKDVNDHSPVFDAGSKLTVGYPIKSLLNALSPPYLVQVQATDLDKDLYADIRYTTTDPDFVVHPKTGVVYPGENAFDNNITRQFSVVATDMDGADGGKSATLDIEVKLLTQQHLTFLTIQNKLLEDLEDVLEELSTKTNLKINYLTAVITPKEEIYSANENLRKLKSIRDNDDYGIKLIIYALDKNNEPVQSETLQQTLEDVEGVDDLTTNTWNPSCGGVIYERLTNSTGYIAAIAVLASLLVIFMIAAGVLYYLKIYKKRKPEPYNSMTEEDSGSASFEKPELNGDDKMPERRQTGYVFNPPPIDEDDDETDNSKYESIPNKGWPIVSVPSTYNDPIIFKQTYEKTYDGDHKLQIMDDEVDKKNKDESRERSNSPDYENPFRKSVSFKPIVEKINIVVDNDKQDDEDVDVRL